MADRDTIPLRRDVTRPEEIAAAAAAAGDVTTVVNNAGIGGAGTRFPEGAFDHARQEMEVSYLGTWAVSRAFAPVLGRNSGGALVNMRSVASWVGRPLYPGYAASKAVQWSLTNSLRQGLREQGTLVVGGYMPVQWTRISVPGRTRRRSVRSALPGRPCKPWPTTGAEVLADENTRQVKTALSQPLNAGPHV